MLSAYAKDLECLSTAVLEGLQQAEGEFVRHSSLQSRIPAPLAIEIYRNNTHGARANALISVYPVCRKVIGELTFESIIRAYVKQDRYGQANLNNYGGDFSVHLDTLINAGRLSTEFSYLPDLALLEYQLHAAYYVEADPLFDFDGFAHDLEHGADPCFQLASSLSLLASQYPVYDIWMKNQSEAGLREIMAVDRVQYYLIHRLLYLPDMFQLEHAMFEFIKSCQQGVSLRSLVEAHGEIVNTLLPRCIQNKWIVGFY